MSIYQPSLVRTPEGYNRMAEPGSPRMDVLLYGPMRLFSLICKVESQETCFLFTSCIDFVRKRPECYINAPNDTDQHLWTLSFGDGVRFLAQDLVLLEPEDCARKISMEAMLAEVGVLMVFLVSTSC